MTRKSNASIKVPNDLGTERGFKYAIHNLDLSRVRLTESPLDDYQRLFFATLLSRPNVDQRRNIDVRRVTYKSNIAESFACPSSGIAPDAAVPKENDSTSPKSAIPERRSSGSQAKKVLDCFEYQLPDVDTANELGLTELSSLPEVFKENLGLKDRPKQLLKGSIFTLRDEKEPSNAYMQRSANAGGGEFDDKNGNSLTKNQQFKLRKLDHNLQQNSRLINPNNCVLWTHSSGYVFLTGIWRLCQDVMRGLISVPRLDEAKTQDLQNMCKKELAYIITTAFYESSTSALPVSPTDRRKRRYSTGSNINSTLNVQTVQGGGFSASESPNSASSNPHYTDLHWSNLSKELKDMMCETYKNHLIRERGYSAEEVADCDYSEVIKRIRGGYIKIQGTWLPFETARLLCVRFCYPIRYLLVPIFGPFFPKECEDWYTSVRDCLLAFEREQQMLIDNSQEFQFQQRRRKRRDSIKTKVSKPVGNDLLNAFQNLLDISKNPVPLETQVRRRSSSCAPEYTAVMPRRSSSEKLPPISTIMQYVSPRSSVAEQSDAVSPKEVVSGSAAVIPEKNRYIAADAYPRRFRQSQIYPNPTVQTLSHLASFYNTHGHRYSYPGNVYMSHQKPVLGKPHSTSINNCEPPEYAAAGIPATLHSSQEPTLGLGIINYESPKVADRHGTEKWFLESAQRGSVAEDITSPKTKGSGQSTKGESLVTAYPDVTTPYWFKATR